MVATAAHERCKILELSAKRWRGKAVQVRLMHRVQGPLIATPLLYICLGGCGTVATTLDTVTLCVAWTVLFPSYQLKT